MLFHYCPPPLRPLPFPPRRYYDISEFLGQLFSWSSPLRSTIYLLLWISMCYYPRYLLASFHWYLLYRLYTEYILNRIRQCPELQTKFGSDNPSDFVEQDDTVHLSGFVKTVGKIVPASYVRVTCR